MLVVGMSCHVFFHFSRMPEIMIVFAGTYPNLSDHTRGDEPCCKQMTITIIRPHGQIQTVIGCLLKLQLNPAISAVHSKISESFTFQSAEYIYHIVLV